MTDFYKMDPAAWDFGTASLTLEQEAAYLRIVNAIHKHKAALPDNDRILAGLFRTSTRKARALLNDLIDAKKVRIEDGLIINDRAISDLVHRGFVSISRAESGAKGGRNRAANAANALKNNDAEQANASSRVEESREDTLDDKSSNAATAPIDPEKVMFDSGRKLLASAGLSQAKAGSLLGKWRKDHGTEAVIAALGRAQLEGAIDPVAFIEGCFRFRAKTATPADGEVRIIGGIRKVYHSYGGWAVEHV